MSIWDGLDEDMSRTDLAEEIQRLRARVAELETAARLRCTCDYAGLEGYPHRPWCEQENGPHAECAVRLDVAEARIAELEGAGNAVADTVDQYLNAASGDDWFALSDAFVAWRSAAGGDTRG